MFIITYLYIHIYMNFYVVYTYICTFVPMYVYMYRLQSYKNKLLRTVILSLIEHTVISMKAVRIWSILVLSKFAKNVVKKNACIRQVNTVLSLRVLRHWYH
jgi:hypothetical protein